MYGANADLNGSFRSAFGLFTSDGTVRADSDSCENANETPPRRCGDDGTRHRNDDEKSSRATVTAKLAYGLSVDWWQYRVTV